MEIEFDKKIFLSILIIIVFSMSVYTFIKSYNNLDVEGDGFIFLTFSKFKVLLGDHVRSPILTIFLLPDIHLARIEMILFHLAITVTIFLFILKLTQNNLISFLGGILYGTSWWFVDFTRYILLDLQSLFFVLLSIFILIHLKLEKKYVISGILLGLAFIIKPTYGIFAFLTSIILFSKNYRKPLILFLVSFILIAVFLELSLDYIFFKPRTGHLNIVYTPWESLYLNLLSDDPSAASNFYQNVELDHFLQIITRESTTPLTEPVYRWILLPLIPFLIIGFCFFLNKKLKTNKYYHVVLGVILVYVMFNSIILFSLKIPDFRPDLVQIPKSSKIVSNYPQVVSYFSGMSSSGLKRGDYEYLVLFDHPNSKRIFSIIKNYADNRLQLLSSYEQGWSIYVYKIPKAGYT